MRKTLVISIFIVLLSPNLFSQWTIISSGMSIPHYAGLNCLYFTTIDTGFITSANGRLYRTTNGGINWSFQVISNEYLSSIRFVNSNTGFIAATNGRWFKTTNGGNNWSSFTNAGYAGSLTDMFFINLNTGWCVGGNGSGSNFVSKTTNGGSNWVVQRNFTEQNTSYSVVFTSVDTGFTNCGNKIWLTTNGGTNWDIAYSSSNYLCHFFFKGNVGFAVGLNGTVVKTTNNGINWNTSFSPTSSKTLWQSSFKDANTGWIVGDSGSIYYTINGGLNYTQQSIGTTKDISAIFFVNQKGWCLGSFVNDTTSGIVLTTTLVPSSPTLISPPNNATGLPLIDTLVWSVSAGATSYRVQLSTDSTFNSNLIVNDSTITGTSRIVNGLINLTKYYWRVNAKNAGGTSNYSATWNFTPGFVGITNSNNEIPKVHKLYPNYPNPFNPSTTIKFDLPLKSYATIKIYDILGRQVTQLFNEILNPGSYEVNWSSNNYASGIYYYIFESNSFKDTKRMVLLK